MTLDTIEGGRLDSAPWSGLRTIEQPACFAETPQKAELHVS